MTFEDRLGVHSKKTKVNMGPIKRVQSLELNFHGILIRLSDDITWLVRIQRLRNINHMRKPFDMLFRIWPKLLDKLRGYGHLFLSIYSF